MKPTWPKPGFNPTLLSQQGYFVLWANPRGSYGQGEKFTLANVRDFARSAKKTGAAVAADVRRVHERLDKQDVRLHKLEEQVHSVRQEVSEGLLRVNVQLGAMMRALQQMRASTNGQSGAAKRLSGRSIPVTVGSEEPQWSPVIGVETAGVAGWATVANGPHHSWCDRPL